MTVCIIGAGPAGLLTAKHLSPLKVKLFDPNPLGKSITHFIPSKLTTKYINSLESILKNSDIEKRKIENLKEINNQCEAFVIAIGGEPKEGLGISLDEIIEKQLQPNSATLIGLGDTSFDLSKRLKGKINILGRKSLFDSNFSNHLLKELGSVNFNCRINEAAVDKRSDSRKKFALESNDPNSRINLFFDAFPIEILKRDNKFIIKLKNGKIVESDCIINTTGYKPKGFEKLVEGIKKPIFYVGACSDPKGNFGDITLQTKEIAEKIKKLFSNK